MRYRPLHGWLLIILFIAAALLPASAAAAAGDPVVHQLSVLRHGLEQIMAYARTRADIFNGDGEILKREQKMSLWTAWAALQDHMAQLDDLRATHGHWFEIKTNSVRSRFLFREYALFLTGYRYAMEFIALSDHNPAVDVLLNEAVPELGLEAGRYKSFKFHFLNVARATEFAAFEVIYKLEKPLPGLFADVIQADREVIWRMGRGQGAALTAKNAISIVKDSLQQAWFPVQKRAATWMGETRVLRGDSALISSEQVAGLQPRLQPGDILLERREWYMSNLGLPGFWTHVALYVGTADERRDYFKGADVEAWLKTRQPAAASLEDLLAVRYPEACRKSSGLQDGHPMRIVEAVSEGVVFTTLEHSAAADSLAVLRPRLSRGEKARAIERAFHYSGRPYDYNFDFQTDMALVCSELVYKAYEPSRTATGLKFELTQVMGRWLLPPNEIARMFDAEADLTGRQTDLVVFLDGYESLQQAVEADTRAFRLSWKRPKWHIILQHAETATSKAE